MVPVLERPTLVADQSFNRITVDGDTSTNDAFLLAATGAAGNDLIEEDAFRLALFSAMAQRNHCHSCANSTMCSIWRHGDCERQLGSRVL